MKFTINGRTPIGKSQERAMRLFGITLTLADGERPCYGRAQIALDAAGLEPDGVPLGHDWRSAAKLSDAEYFEAMRHKKSPAVAASPVAIIEIGDSE